jgi:hypothetical protein
MKLAALTDYKGRFGSKHFDQPYRSGMDKDKLKFYFSENEVELCFIPMSSAWVDVAKDFEYFIYTSSEDEGYRYKSFIEDIVLGLELKGCIPIPGYAYLKANNNKVFMEFLRSETKDERLNTIRTQFFGTLEELILNKENIDFPAVVKMSAGASGRGVFKANNEVELIHVVKTVSNSRSLVLDLKDWLRSKRHDNYQRDSRNRNKFIVQNLIPDLVNDWKVYWFNGELYVFYRPILKHRDFIASGGGYDNYLYGEDAPKPDGFFQFVEHVMSFFQGPNASMDIAYDGLDFHLIEIQFLYFGTAGIPYSKGYYKKSMGHWVYLQEKREIEQVYAQSIATFLRNGA